MERCIIWRQAGSVLYLKSALGINDETIRKIGTTDNESSRKRGYRSSGNLSGWIHSLVGDKVDEFMSHVYYQDFKYSNLDTGNNISDFFNYDERLDNSFKCLKLSNMYCDIFKDITQCKNYWRFIIINPKNYKITVGTYKKGSINDWLLSEPRTKRSVGFWRSLLYTYGNFDSILLSDIDKSCDSSLVDLFTHLKEKLSLLSSLFSLNRFGKHNVIKLKNLYLSYCCTMDVGIRKMIENDICEIFNRYSARL